MNLLKNMDSEGSQKKKYDKVFVLSQGCVWMSRKVEMNVS